MSLYKLIIPKNDISHEESSDEVIDPRLFVSHKTLYKYEML